jgi:hypothetical protein
MFTHGERNCHFRWGGKEVAVAGLLWFLKEAWNV